MGGWVGRRSQLGSGATRDQQPAASAAASQHPEVCQESRTGSRCRPPAAAAGRWTARRAWTCRGGLRERQERTSAAWTPRYKQQRARVRGLTSPTAAVERNVRTAARHLQPSTVSLTCHAHNVAALHAVHQLLELGQLQGRKVAARSEEDGVMSRAGRGRLAGGCHWGCRAPQAGIQHQSSHATLLCSSPLANSSNSSILAAAAANEPSRHKPTLDELPLTAHRTSLGSWRPRPAGQRR